MATPLWMGAFCFAEESSSSPSPHAEARSAPKPVDDPRWRNSDATTKHDALVDTLGDAVADAIHHYLTSGENYDESAFVGSIVPYVKGQTPQVLQAWRNRLEPAALPLWSNIMDAAVKPADEPPLNPITEMIVAGIKEQGEYLKTHSWNADSVPGFLSIMTGLLEADRLAVRNKIELSPLITDCAEELKKPQWKSVRKELIHFAPFPPPWDRIVKEAANEDLSSHHLTSAVLEAPAREARAISPFLHGRLAEPPPETSPEGIIPDFSEDWQSKVAASHTEKEKNREKKRKAKEVARLRQSTGHALAQKTEKTAAHIDDQEYHKLPSDLADLPPRFRARRTHLPSNSNRIEHLYSLIALFDDYQKLSLKPLSQAQAQSELARLNAKAKLLGYEFPALMKDGGPPAGVWAATFDLIRKATRHGAQSVEDFGGPKGREYLILDPRATKDRQILYFDPPAPGTAEKPTPLSYADSFQHLIEIPARLSKGSPLWVSPIAAANVRKPKKEKNEQALITFQKRPNTAHEFKVGLQLSNREPRFIATNGDYRDAYEAGGSDGRLSTVLSGRENDIESRLKERALVENNLKNEKSMEAGLDNESLKNLTSLIDTVLGREEPHDKAAETKETVALPSSQRAGVSRPPGFHYYSPDRHSYFNYYVPGSHYTREETSPVPTAWATQDRPLRGEITPLRQFSCNSNKRITFIPVEGSVDATDHIQWLIQGATGKAHVVLSGLSFGNDVARNDLFQQLSKAYPDTPLDKSSFRVHGLEDQTLNTLIANFRLLTSIKNRETLTRFKSSLIDRFYRDPALWQAWFEAKYSDSFTSTMAARDTRLAPILDALVKSAQIQDKDAWESIVNDLTKGPEWSYPFDFINVARETTRQLVRRATSPEGKHRYGEIDFAGLEKVLSQPTTTEHSRVQLFADLEKFKTKIDSIDRGLAQDARAHHLENIYCDSSDNLPIIVLAPSSTTEALKLLLPPAAAAAAE